MCCGVRCTDRRRTASSLIFDRLRSARRRRVSCLVNFICLLLLRLFQRNLLVRILHALALIGLRRPKAPNLGGRLTDSLAVDALDQNLRLRRRLDGDAVGDRVVDEVRIAQGQRKTLRLDGGTVADTHELELLLVALGHARDHVREMRERRARDGVQALAVAAGLDGKMLLVRLDHFNAGLERERQRTLGTLDRDGFTADGHGNALREIDRFFCNSRHSKNLLERLLDLLNDEEHFAAGTGRARLLVRHDAMRRGNNRHTQAAQSYRKYVLAAVDPESRTADAFDAIDDRPAVVILELDGQRALGAGRLDVVRAYIAFILQYLENGKLQLRCPHAHCGLARGLRVADAGQKIGDGISHAHCARLTSWPSTGPEFPHDWPPRAVC